MKQEVKDKVLAKMLNDGSITKKEFESGDVSEARIDMWASGIELLRLKSRKLRYTVTEQLRLREAEQAKLERTEPEGEQIKHCKSQIKKLERLIERYQQEETITGRRKTAFANTQKEEVIRHLEETQTITSYEAFTEYGITRLSAIIYNLRHDLNMSIETSNVTRRNRYGNAVTFAKYTLKKKDKHE